MKKRFILPAFILLSLLQACEKNDNPPSTNVIASFSISGYEIAAPSTITYINFSQHATSYFWNFGDGTTSTAHTPTHTYAAGGSYQIQLAATGPSGSQTICKIVTIADAPAANKSAFAYFFDKCSGIPVGASFKTINPLSTNVVWDFGNGNVNISRDPIIQFLLVGDYTLKYSSQINGVRDTVTRIIQITQ